MALGHALSALLSADAVNFAEILIWGWLVCFARLKMDFSDARSSSGLLASAQSQVAGSGS